MNARTHIKHKNNTRTMHPRLRTQTCRCIHALYRSAKVNALRVDSERVSLMSAVRPADTRATTSCAGALYASVSGTSPPMTYNKLRVSNTTHKLVVTKHTADDGNHPLNCALRHRLPQDRADFLHGTIGKVHGPHLAT